MTFVLIERLRVHRDARGWVIEPLGPDGLPAQRNVHAVLSQPGAVRGNHYHPRGTESLTVEGPARVRLRERGEVRDVAVEDGEFVRLVIPPGISHAIQNTGARPTLLVAFNSVEHDPADPDVVRDVLIEG